MKEEIEQIVLQNSEVLDNGIKVVTIYNFEKLAEEIEQLIENAIEANDCVKMDRR